MLHDLHFPHTMGHAAFVKVSWHRRSAELAGHLEWSVVPDAQHGKSAGALVVVGAALVVVALALAVVVGGSVTVVVVIVVLGLVLSGWCGCTR